MREVIIKVNNMVCPSCMTKIQKAFSKHKGITNVRVLFNAGKVKLEVSEPSIDAQELESVINKLGYETESVLFQEK